MVSDWRILITSLGHSGSRSLYETFAELTNCR